MNQNSNYFERLRRRRHRKLVANAGKRLIFNEEEMLNDILDDRVPVMMQHCVLKVQPKMRGSEREKFVSAYNICAANFQRHGYLRHQNQRFSDESGMRGGSQRMRMTGRGIQNNRKHQRERNAGTKKAQWRALLTRLWSAALSRIKAERKGLN